MSRIPHGDQLLESTSDRFWDLLGALHAGATPTATPGARVAPEDAALLTALQRGFLCSGVSLCWWEGGKARTAVACSGLNTQPEVVAPPAQFHPGWRADARGLDLYLSIRSAGQIYLQLRLWDFFHAPAPAPIAVSPAADSPTANSPTANSPTADSPTADSPTLDSLSKNPQQWLSALLATIPPRRLVDLGRAAWALRAHAQERDRARQHERARATEWVERNARAGNLPARRLIAEAQQLLITFTEPQADESANTDEAQSSPDGILAWGLLHRLLGEDWSTTVRNSPAARREPDRRSLANLLQTLETRSPAPTGELAAAMTLLGAFAGLPPRPLPIDLAPGLSLFVTAALAVEKPGEGASPSPHFLTLCEQIGRILPGLLQHTLSAGAWTAATLRRTLRLVFLHRLLEAPPSGNATTVSGPQLPIGGLRAIPKMRAAFALVARESIRGLWAGGQAWGSVTQSALLDALCDLLDHHSRFHLLLPGTLSVSAHLRRILKSSPIPGTEFATEHLHHVLEHALGAELLLSLHLSPPGATDSNPLGALLAARGYAAGPQEVRELRQAALLAALYHDTGLLFAPLTPDIALPDSSTQRTLTRIADDLATACRELIDEAWATLNPQNANPNDPYFSEADRQALTGWLEAQHKAGRPDHGLLGALSFHAASTSLPHELRRATIRAIVFHSAPQVAISLPDDPVAALLILCDELFDWDPGRETPHSHPAHTSRAGHLTLRNLHIQPPTETTPPPVTTPQFTTPWPPLILFLTGQDLHFDIHLRWTDQPHFQSFPTYLAVAQNIARIKAPPGSPTFHLHLTAPLPATNRRAAISTLTLLTHLLSNSTEDWREILLHHYIETLPTPEADADEESIHITTHPAFPLPFDLRPHLPALQDEAPMVVKHLAEQQID